MLFISNPKGGGWIQTLMDTPGLTHNNFEEAVAYIRATGATEQAIAEYIREYEDSGRRARP